MGKTIEKSFFKREFIEPEPAPDVVTATESFERIVLVRLRSSTDLLAGLKEAVEREGIKNGVILMGIGSLVSYHIHLVANETFPHEEIFIKEEGPFDLLNVNGYVLDGRVHAHITLSDESRAIGGHLEPDTNIFTFVAVTIGVLAGDTDISRFDGVAWR